MGIEVTSGYYVLDREGQYRPLDIDKLEVTETVSDELEITDGIFPLSLNEPFQCTFTTPFKVTEKQLVSLLGWDKAVVNACPNKTVKWLVAHSKKKRVRTKNVNRAFRILEG